MQVPRLVWKRRHNLAVLTVSFAHRIWNTREVGDVVLGYNATGRLCRIVLLNPIDLIGDNPTLHEAISQVTEWLLRQGRLRQEELDVLTSALDRAERRPPPCGYLR